MSITVRDNRGRIAKGSNRRHGLSDAPVYDCWVAMKARCLNEQHPMYHLYGGRGIMVYPEWVTSFDAFYKYMGDKPTPKHTLDRENNDGNYEPGNVRWLSHHRQQLNRRDNTDSPGVYYERSRDRYRADITVNGKKYFLGRYKLKDEAIAARKAAEIEHAV